VLEVELVKTGQAVSEEDFRAIFCIGGIIPSTTVTALAVAYGDR
jgi:chromate transport protein ChrA